MYYFYILVSGEDGRHYYGSTSNLKKRFTDHNNGKVTSTKFRRPLRLIYYKAYEGLQNARFRKKQVKRSSAIRANLHKRI
ncbi:GIY-YIG nuclease family protein [Candidatus Parcubacteria bacterium]|nr:GIY-YIG nuclease family protein [Candidatus Parcubacteria bacterium]